MPDWRSVIRSRLAPTSIGPGDDVADEIAQHAEALFQRARADGASEEEATAAVERELRDLSALARAARAARRRRLAVPEPPPPGKLQTGRAFVGDLAYGLRLLAARRGFTVAAVLTLALGIGANTAIFSVVNALLLAPLPFSNPDRLVMLWEADAEDLRRTYIVSAPNWVGVRPQLGRTFTAEEDTPGHRVAVISDTLWRRRFGASPGTIGQTMRLNGEPYELIGVMPPSFRFTQEHAVWIPIQFNERDAGRSWHSFFAAARVKDGVPLESARADIEAIGQRLAASYPADNRGEGATITRMSDFGVEPLQPTLFALVGAVAFVLLIACVNVANLALAQTSSRQREFAIRAALGAARGRLAAQLLAEGLLLALAGGAAGVLLAWAGTTALSESLPPAIRFAPFRTAGTASLDGRVLAFTSLVALVTGVLFSLAPMVGAARTRPGATLKAAGDRSGTGRLTGLRHILVASEVALALVVLFGAGLMIKSVARLVSVDPGLDRGNVLLMDMTLPQEDFYGPPVRTSFCADVQRELASLPGVRSVGAISHLPLSGANAGRGLTIEGRAIPEEGWAASYRLTCPGYFNTLGIPIVKGRDFNAHDTITSPAVVIINEELARRYFESQDPVGQRFKLGRADSSNPWLTIVGIARDVRHFGLDSSIRREIFRPYAQAAWPSMTIAVKTQVEPLTLAAPVKTALARIDSDQPVSRVRTMETVIADSIGGRRFPMLLLALFSAVALTLAAIGVYGVVSYLVAQRTREMGIRVALGARRPQVIRLVVSSSLRPVAVGFAIGIVGAVLSARLLTTLLYSVEPSDPSVLTGIAAILGATALVASWLPARRAAGVDPLVALREE